MRILLTPDQIQQAAVETAKRIAHTYKNPPIFVGVLNGAIPFMMDIAIAFPDPDCEFDFIGVSSYDGIESTGSCVLTKDLQTDIEGRDVVIIEDIIDTGRTADFILNTLRHRNPSRIEIFSLLDKPMRREVEFANISYWAAKMIPDEFVVGYGLDYNGRYRMLPYIAVLEDHEISDQ